jgi:hypothetical protein
LIHTKLGEKRFGIRELLRMTQNGRGIAPAIAGPSVIPGHAEGVNPESSVIDFLCASGFRIAATRRPE